MRLVIILSVLLMLITPVRAQSPEPAPVAALPSVQLPPGLERVLRDYERAWEGKNAPALAALFAEDGFVLSNERPPVRGRAAIREAYANAGGGLALRALAWSTSGSVGYIIGAYATKAGGADSGKFVLALRRGTTGRWLISADMDNPNQRPRSAPQLVPPAPAPPAPAPAPPPTGAESSYDRGVTQSPDLAQ